MTTKALAVSTMVLVAGAAVVTAVVLAGGTPAYGEDRLARSLQDVEWFRPIAGSVRALTGTEVVLLLGVAGVIWLSSARAYRRAVALGLVLVLLLVAQVGIKEAIDRGRPSEPYVVVHASGTSPSYPSGHAMGGTLLWGYLLLAQAPPGLAGRFWWGFVRAGAAFLVVSGPVGSVFLGAHWPTDVIGGALIGGALVATARAIETWGTDTHPGEWEAEHDDAPPGAGRF